MPPATVGGQQQVAVPAEVVTLSEFVTHVDHRHAAETERERIQQEETVDSDADAGLVAVLHRGGDPQSVAVMPEVRSSPVSGFDENGTPRANDCQ